MISKLALQKIFQKNIQILEAWKPANNIKFRIQNFEHLVETSTKCYKLCEQNIKKKTKAKKLNFKIFLSFIFVVKDNLQQVETPTGMILEKNKM